MEDIYNLVSNVNGDKLELSIDGDIGTHTGNDSDQLAMALNENPNAREIELKLNSNGGSLFQGISMFNQLESHPANVTTIVNGIAASATSIIFMAGSKRLVRTGGFVVPHKPMSIGVNNADQMRDKAEQLDKFQDAIVDIYEAKTSMTREDINTLVNNETWLNASDALEKGFATESTDIEAEVTNKIDYCEFVNSYSAEIPKGAKKYFKNQNKYKIQQVLNKLTDILNINPNKKEDDMKPEEVQNMLADALSKQNDEFSNKLTDVRTDFQNKLTEKDGVINSLTEKVTAQDNKIIDLEAKATTSTIENVVDGFISNGRIAPANRDFEIENLKLREGKESFDTYKNSIASRKPVVDMTHNFAHNGVDRNSTTNLDQEIKNMLAENNLTLETADHNQITEASAKARQKISGGK